jgi:cytochrome P450
MPEERGLSPMDLQRLGSVKAASFMTACKSYPSFANMLMKCMPPSIRAKRDAHFEFASQRAEQRMAMDTSRKDFMSYILKHNDDKGMSRSEITVNTALLVLAGSEMTATLLSGTTFYLLSKPEKLRKLTEEIRSTFKSEDEIDFNSISDLKYLIACLTEGLRVYPPVPVGLSRIVPEGGDYISDYWVPEGVSPLSYLYTGITLTQIDQSVSKLLGDLPV